MPSASHKPHVLILGAGLAGLTLAQALRKKGITSETFERDKNQHARIQGWAIALHFILDDIEKSLPDDLPPISITSHLQPLDLKPEICVYKVGENKPKVPVGRFKDGQLVRANRKRLRDWLATHLDIQWDKHATRIEEENDSVTIHFADGTSSTGDILVGADGVHSFTRHHLLDGEGPLETVPLGHVVGEPVLDKSTYQRQLDLAHSAYIVLGQKDNTRIFVGLNEFSEDASEGRYYWLMSWDDPAAAHEPYWTHSASKQEMYDFAQKRVAEMLDGEPRLTEIVRLTTPEQILAPPIVLRDMVLPGLPNRRVTLVGDAAHPMTPFRAEGGNNALLDSLKLARAIDRSDPDTLLECLKEYQDEMLERGTAAVKASRAAGAAAAPTLFSDRQ